MPLFEETKQQQATTKPEVATNSETKKPESNLMTIIGQCLPFAPLVFEQFTGQKVPQLSGTMAEITNSLQQIQISCQTLANNQQALSQRLIALEQNATNQLTNLTNQFKSLRLTHTKEQKQIEYNPPHLEENQENY